MFELYQHVDFFQSPAIVSASRNFFGNGTSWFPPFFYLLFLIPGLVGLAVEVWLMKYYRWGSLMVCIGDALLLNLACGLSIFALARVIPSLVNVAVCLCLTILVKGFLTAKLSDLPQSKAWTICTIATIASYIASYGAFYIVLSGGFGLILR